MPRADWPFLPLKAVAKYFVSSVDKLSSEDEEPVRLCNYTDVYKNDYIQPAMDLMAATASESEIERFRLRINDVVITKDSESWDDIGVPALVIETADDLVCGYHLAVIRPCPEKLSGRFLFRCLQAKSIRLHLELAASGVTRFGLPKEAIGNVLLPLPPLAVQECIADYLDGETARMDGLVAEKERMLALLEEKRAALVSHAVTRGLNPDAPTKASGLDWLGPIPAHWQIRRAKYLFELREQLSECGEEELLTVSHITGVTSRTEKDVNMFKADDMSGYKMCEPGDLVINTLWAWMGAMGVSKLAGIVSPAYHVYTPRKDLLVGFVDALCRSKPFVAEVIRHSKGVWSSRLRLYPESFFDIRLPVPPLEEQAAILAHLKQERARTAALEEALRASIALLKERRAALISAAVTGQLTIPGEH